VSIAVPTPLSKTRDPRHGRTSSRPPTRSRGTRARGWSWCSRAPPTRARRASCSSRA
jgi:hypothetical protein